MKPGRIRTFALLVGAIALPSFSKDWLFVTTNWNHPGNEQVLLIDPENGRIRTLWNRGTELDAVVAPDASRLYVTFIYDKRYELAVVEVSTGTVLHLAEIPQLIRWIHPSTPGMAISPEGRWLYLLKANYAAGSSEYSLLRFDTQENLFVSGDQPISNCSSPHALPVPGDRKVLVLCRGGTATHTSDDDIVLRLEHFQDFALGRGSNEYTLYAAAQDGRIQAVDVATHEVVQISADAPLRYRRVMPCSATMSPDGRLWYLPIKIPDDGQQDIEQILVFDTQTMSLATVITPAGPFWGLVLSADGRQLYASQPDLQNIMVIDTATRQTVRIIGVGAKPSILLAVKAP
jgi:DNA-binding beta-propeller fold protein YncE